MPVSEEEKAAVCCASYTGTLRAIEEAARLVTCCGATGIDPKLFEDAVEIAQEADEKLREILAEITGADD